jgi:hypothetical protein
MYYFLMYGLPIYGLPVAQKGAVPPDTSTNLRDVWKVIRRRERAGCQDPTLP